jgi:hypothetical protein
MNPDQIATEDLSAAEARPQPPAADQGKTSVVTVDQPRRTETEEPAIPLFSDEETGQLRTRWDEIQAGFVDEPRGAVEKADGLVAEAMSRLADGFARTRSDLDHKWKRGDAISTEDLRQALRRYRSFFARLLAV